MLCKVLYAHKYQECNPRTNYQQALGETKRLSYELYLKNLKNPNESPKRITAIKKIYVEAKDALTIQLDPKTLEEYGDDVQQDIVFRELLSMPLNYLKSVGLPFRSTGSASKKPYITFYSSIFANKA